MATASDEERLAEIADELYGLSPEEFIAARSEHEKRARAAGDRELATAIKSLAKPNIVAWLGNQLAREHADEIEPLVEIGDAMREATRALSGAELRELSKQQRQLVRALVQQAKALAAAAGRRISTENERGLEATLHAAMADPQAAAALVEGHLATGLQTSGFGEADSEDSGRPNLRLVPTRPTPARTPRTRKGTGTAADEPKLTPAQKRQAAALERAQAELDTAVQRAEEIENEFAATRDALATAQGDAQTAAAKVEQLRGELADAQAEQRIAEHAAKKAQTVFDRQEQATRAIQRRLDQARSTVKDLQKS